MEVFIVRPFGKERPVLKKDKKTDEVTTVKYNFDAVETDLIAPALQQLNLSGGTTGKIFEAGDIREDMFSLLLLADIVIADITIHNANVFYELGIRHALRDKKTILLKCADFDETPFDILAYRYVSYAKDDPAASLPDLVTAIRETMQSDRKDSPVFNILPYLVAQDTERYLALPKDFIDEVSITAQVRSAGKLSLLAYEAEGFTWKVPALRLIGEALFNMKAFESARLIWEKIRAAKPNDTLANDRLATIYQRLAENEIKINPDEAASLLAKSDLAIDDLLQNKDLNKSQLAETYSLKARNAKSRWLQSWKDFPDNIRGSKALQSMYLTSAFTDYEKGFYADLNHFYSGINALGLLVTIISLAETSPDIWELAYESKEDAELELKKLKTKYQQLSTTVQVSISSARAAIVAKGETDPWLNITEADYMCLTSVNPAKVGGIYTKVIQDAGALNMDATTRQLLIYEMLGVKPDNIKAALAALPSLQNGTSKTTQYVLFTGHMIDKPDRETPRFPASKEAAVRESLKQKLTEIKNKVDDNHSLMGIAGGGCGGDILFHEVCAELGIPSQMYLALPREQFLVESVAFAGNDWIERFDKLFQKIPHPFLSDSDSKDLPKWLQKKPDYNIWERNNLWELNSALVNGGMNMTLLALWDGKGGDGAGGTEHMVKIAREKGAKVDIIDMLKV